MFTDMPGGGESNQSRLTSNKKDNLATYGSIQLDTEIGDSHDTLPLNWSYVERPSIQIIFVCSLLLFSLIDQNVRSKISLIGHYLRKSNDHLLTEKELFLDDDSFTPLIGKRTLELALLHDNMVTPEPFSTLDPVKDLNFTSYTRSDSSMPQQRLLRKLSEGVNKTKFPLPTNKWYENMLLVDDQDNEPSLNNRAYTVPYVVDAAGPISGIRLFGSRVLAMTRIVQVTFEDLHGLTIGSASNVFLTGNISTAGIPKRYQLYDSYSGDDDEKASAYPLTPLGLTVKWEPTSPSANLEMMTSSIVRGMPYGTMHYHMKAGTSGDPFSQFVPTVTAEIELLSPPIVDSSEQMFCYNGPNNTLAGTKLVEKSVLLSFRQSDFSWLVFYSHPVYVKCFESVGSIPFLLQVVGLADGQSFDAQNHVFTSRVALMNNCTRGTNPSYCFQATPTDRKDFSALLHKHAHIYPGAHSKIDYTFFSDEILGGGPRAYLQFDWDPRDYRSGQKLEAKEDESQLLMYSLPHHRDRILSAVQSPNRFIFDDALHCTPSLNGRACIVEGSNWVMEEDLDGEPSFYAPRRPDNRDLVVLAQAISHDIHFDLPSYFKKGAGDTYFSGKMLAKLARIIMITKELIDICSPYANEDIPTQCHEIELPSEKIVNDAIGRLKRNTEIWINGNAVTPFVYDNKWGGIVSCGCHFNGAEQTCYNEFPVCPSFDDHGLDFGHGVYNDHHFHQGYHIYAAAAASYLDPDWGKKNFERVLIMIRDIANPSIKDSYFPTYRMKDWYLGNSWAGGIAMAYPNGRNQESSSESIAAYEAVALYGKIMADIWEQAGVVSLYSRSKATVSRHIRDVGRLLTATEIRSADRYWHVRQDRNGDDVYPIQYEPHVVGIMWNMMAQFQTWFGADPHLVYGIQLMPLTPVAERRDDVLWLKQLYLNFDESCKQSSTCEAQGWGIPLNAVLATIGHRERAVRYAASLNASVFESAGGNGHSRTNTIWYYSTRPPTDPFPLPLPPVPSNISNATGSHAASDLPIDCGCPDSCTDAVLDAPAGGYTCGMRISWLIKYGGRSEREACEKVGRFEFPKICSGCTPSTCSKEAVFPPHKEILCPPCDLKICTNHVLNRCPLLDAPYLCTGGTSMGGCATLPWRLGSEGGMSCTSCCLLTVDCDKATSVIPNNTTQSSSHPSVPATKLISENTTQISSQSSVHKPLLSLFLKFRSCVEWVRTQATKTLSTTQSSSQSSVRRHLE